MLYTNSNVQYNVGHLMFSFDQTSFLAIFSLQNINRFILAKYTLLVDVTYFEQQIVVATKQTNKDNLNGGSQKMTVR